MRLPPCALCLLAALCVLAGPARAAPQAPPCGPVFLLPVERGSYLFDDSAEVLSERLAQAVDGAGAGKSRSLTERDIAAARRPELPADLGGCRSPECVQRLGLLTGAGRVLSLRVLREGSRTVAFGTLFDGRRGGVLWRKEWPLAEGGSQALAREVGRWLANCVEVLPPLPAQAPQKPRPPLVQVTLPDGPTPEGELLLRELISSLGGVDGLRVAGPGAAVDLKAVTHRAEVTIGRAAVTTEKHHVRHYRDGVLAAALTIREARGGATVFAAQAQATASAKARYSSEQALLPGMAREVVAAWMREFWAQGGGQRLRAN